MTSVPEIPRMRWGSNPELIGPRHLYRVGRLTAWLARAVPGGHILDAGCGAGTLTETLARRGYHVTAVDGAVEFVDHLRRRVAGAGLSDRVEVYWADLQHGDLPAAAFDGAVCGEVLEHLPDDAAAVASIARSLKPGGSLVLTVPAGAERYTWVDEWAGHVRRYEEPALRELVEGAGLEIQAMVRWGFPFMMLYERHLQAHGLAQVARGSSAAAPIARLARSSPVSGALGALFTLDRLFEGRFPLGSGFLLRAEKP